MLRGAEVPGRDGVRAAAVCGQRLNSSCAGASPAPASTRTSCPSELCHPTPTPQHASREAKLPPSTSLGCCPPPV